ncbi:uncharacterized protein LOC134659818 isoform X2 [Cydia amplana]|uniref:uncharacterized protein LOC134659818 isoform X2 n=2 Tax=Cydia amplana TaxID=1869771 RepID=UPI002FE59784
MALFMKQNFSPPLLSRKWIAIKFRPNVLLYSREQIICILESGLLFREDSATVELECPPPEKVWVGAGGGGWGWCTRGERGAALLAAGACVLAFPPKTLSRGALGRLAASLACGVLARGLLRYRARSLSRLPALCDVMRRYLALARRAQACVRDNAQHNTLGSVSQALQATHELLCRQQASLATLMSRASVALLGNAPWLRDDLAWATLPDATDPIQKIHHAFLVVQSTLLKHIAMAHFTQPLHTQHVYKNHNERLHWIHTVLLQHLLEEFQENYEALDRMYRIFKNYGTKDVERKSFPVNDRWLYSEVHSGVARTCLDLKMALEKCTNLDMFLDSCAINDQKLDLDVLNEDIDNLIDELAKCLNTMQSSQIRLKKLQRKFNVEEERKEVSESEEEVVLRIEDKPVEVKDEVFYLLKTEEDNEREDIADVTTAPGKKEREATEFMLNELKRKLVKREDVMRERERQALVKTMPELKVVPEFPRQMEDCTDKKGFIKKILKDSYKDRLFKDYKIGSKTKRKRKYKFNVNKYESESEIKDNMEANAKLSAKSKIISISCKNKELIITEWNKKQSKTESSYTSEKETEGSFSQAFNNTVNNAVNKTINEAVNKLHLESSYTSDKDTEAQAVNNTVHKAINNTVNQAANNQIKFTKKDLDFSTSSESDYDHEHQMALLKDIRRHRVARKKNYPVKRVSIDIVDESLKPIEYSFGTGMAIASVLQVNNLKMPNMAAEEVFIGDGEVSNDSGNDEDA